MTMKPNGVDVTYMTKPSYGMPPNPEHESYVAGTEIATAQVQTRPAWRRGGFAKQGGRAWVACGSRGYIPEHASFFFSERWLHGRQFFAIGSFG